jgi:hypothetical protein
MQQKGEKLLKRADDREMKPAVAVCVSLWLKLWLCALLIILLTTLGHLLVVSCFIL